ncbi:hypothetical protein ABQE57_07920 [Mycolicibacterium elephantis]
MSDAEYEWRQRLQPVRLVVETNFSADEVRCAQQKYGAAARQASIQGVSYQSFIKRYSALTLLVLVGHAALEYDQGRYWELFWTELGLGRDPEFEDELRKNLFDLLDKFSLARFPRIEEASAFRYVMTLALHAGIPVHCLGDLLQVINNHISQGRDASGAAVIEWLEEPGKEHRTMSLDVPVRNFLVYGSEFAVDILDRIIEFIGATTADPNLLKIQLDASTTGLPDILLEELIRQLTESPLRIERNHGAARNSGQPSIAYDVDDDQIVLILRAPDADADRPWRVSFDGDVREVHTLRKWGTQTASASVAIPGPVREVIISHPSGTSLALPLIVRSDPLLTFDRNGRLIPRRDGLKDCVWVVYPEEYQLVDTRTHERVDVVETGCPAGWHGWRSSFLELADVTALQLYTADGFEVGSQRPVRKDARPSFRLGTPLRGVFTPEGRTVYSTRPWVMLPPSPSNPGPEWTVRVRRLGELDWICDDTWRAEDVETCVDPFDEDENCQLGLFEVDVTGPLGADARCVVFLAEGLDVQFDTSIRVPEHGGLTPCAAELETAAFAVDPANYLKFEPNRLDAHLTLRAEVTEQEIVVKPPHIEIRTGEAGKPATWRMTPDVCDPDDFSQDRFVEVRAPGVDSVEFAYVSAHGDLLQRDPNPRRRQNDVFGTRTQQFADTARHNPGGKIIARLSTSSDLLDVTVLSAEPRQLASGVELHGDELVFMDVAAVDDLATYVWSSTAPWAEPEVLRVVDGRAALPPALVDAGDLRCQLFIDDPWVMIDPPPTPPDTAFRVDQLGWREDGTSDQVKLSRYLGSLRSAPVEIGAIPEVWAAMAHLYAEGNVDRFEGLTALLADNPRFALDRLGDSTIPAGDKMAMLIRSELVNRDFSAEQTLNELHAHPWFGCMVELSDLPSLYLRRHEVRDERAQTLAYLRDRGGGPLMDLLKCGKDDHAYGACFDIQVFRWSELTGNPIEAKLEGLQRIPLAQLHPENLRAGVYEAYCRRSDWLRSGWTTNFAKQTELVTTPIERASRLAYEAIETRADRIRDIDANEHPWVRMSVQSLTLALLARLEAHGRIHGRYLDRGLLWTWARMAQLCPTMAANDILIAEALVLFDRRGDLTGE